MFQSEDGLFFTRNGDGSVTITKTDGKTVADGGNVLFEQKLDDGSWVSAVLTMSAFNERPGDFHAWMRHHKGEADILARKTSMLEENQVRILGDSRVPDGMIVAMQPPVDGTEPQTVPIALYSAAMEKMQRIGHENSRLRDVTHRATSYYRNQTAHIDRQRSLLSQLLAEATFVQHELQSALAGESETCVGDGCQNQVVYHCSRLFCGAPLCKECAEYDLVPMVPNYYCPTCWKTWLKSLQDGKVGEAGALYAFMGWLTSRDAVSGPFSAGHEAGAAAQLVGQFCEMQGWEITGDRWDRHIKPYREDAPQGGEEATRNTSEQPVIQQPVSSAPSEDEQTSSGGLPPAPLVMDFGGV